ncbi:MAG: toxin-antitoxin system YwqK family antitoxin [Flavobacteriia bacterium]|jgi:antitoxin component YwqK of YwqJK toxin-antitoxin module
MKKSQNFSLIALLVLVFSQVNLNAQETFSYKNETYKVYPHERDANPSWLIYNAVNRKNKQNLQVLYKNEIGEGSSEMDESDLNMGMRYWEMEVFGENSAKIKKKVKKAIRANSDKLFHSYVNMYQTITPSIDPLPDGKYVQFYKNIFALDENGDIQTIDKKVAGIFEMKNNLLHGFAYWISAAGDTIEKGFFDQGQRVGEWTFNEKKDFWEEELNEVKFSYDKSVVEYKEGLLDGKYITYNGDSISSKGFYSAGEPSGEWFFYDWNYTFVNKEAKFDYFLTKHFTYADKNAPISRQILLRNAINRNIFKNDSITMPPNIYVSQVDFNELYTFYKETVEDLELPEEKVTSYDGGEMTEEGDYGMEGGYYEGMEDEFIGSGSYNRENKMWVKGKLISKSKLIDSIGIQFKYKDVYEEYYSNGKLKYRYEFKDGKLLSEDTVFWDNGVVNDVVTFDAKANEYIHETYDYAGKLVVSERFDSIGNYKTSTTIAYQNPIVKIDGIPSQYYEYQNYYIYSKYDTLLKVNLIEPTVMFKSWYFNKKVCAEALFEPTSRDLNIKIHSVNNTLKQNRKITFGEDYSFYSQKVENNMRELQAVTVSNASYDATVHIDSLPQSKMYYLRYFDETDDYTLNYKGQVFNGKFNVAFNKKSPEINIKEKSINIGIPENSFKRKLSKDFKKFQKTGKSKYKNLHDVLDLGMDIESEFSMMFPFLNRVLSEINYNPNQFEGELYGSENNSKATISKVEGQFINGKPSGKWLVFALDGSILREVYYENGEKQGEQKTFAYEYPEIKPKKNRKMTEEDYYYDGMDYEDPMASFRKYPEKKTYYIANVVNYNKGLQNGIEKHTDWQGNVIYTATYKDGYMDGPTLERNEVITTKSSYKDGLLDGILKTQLTIPGKDSITLYDLNFQNHQLQGESKAYHPNGKLAKRGFFLNNEPIDDYEAYDTLGFKYHYVKFQYTFPVEEKIWEENELSVRYLFNWQDSIEFRPNDLVEIPSMYDLLMQYGLMDSYALEQPYYGRPSLINKNGVKYHVTKYFPDQIISRDGPIVNGKKTGCWYYNNYAGQKQYDIEYFDTILKINDSIKFKAKGIRTDFDTLGNALHKSYVIEKIENYDCSHTDHYEVRQFMTIWQANEKGNRMNGFVKNYYDDGTLQSEGNMKDGLPTGVWKYYTPNGMLNQVGEYVQGKRHGRWLKGDLSKTNYIGDICMNPNLPDLEKRVEYQENLLDINIRYFKLGKIVNTEFYDINMNTKK